MREDIKIRIQQIVAGVVPNGYQYQERIGIAPVSWKVRHFSDVVKNVQRPVPKPNAAYWRLGIRSHAKGTFHELVEDPSSVAMNELYVVKEGDLIVNITFAWEHAIALAGADDAGKLVSHRFPTYEFKEKQSPKYFKGVVIQPRFKEMLSNISPGGAGRNRVLSKKEFMKLPCYIPPQKEQEKIAEILNHCDKVIELKKQLIEEERSRKKWLMQNLLDPDSGIRFPGFSSIWKSSKMGEIFEFGSSLSASRAELGNAGICYLHYGDIHANSSIVVNVSAEFNILPKISINNSKVAMLKHGDVVFVDASEDYEGASKYVVVINPDNIPFLPGLHTIPARSKKDVLDIDFKQYCFQAYAFKRQVAFYVSGMKIYGLNKYNLAKIQISYPDKEEQKVIARLLVATDARISLLDQELTQWQQKKKALMQLLLTGIVRVSV